METFVEVDRGHLRLHPYAGGDAQIVVKGPR